MRTDQWSEFSAFPYQCDSCGTTLWFNNEVVMVSDKISFDNIPDLKEGTIVYVDNKEHPKHLQPAEVMDRSHMHYRLEFHDINVWMPQHWIKPLPKEMYSI